MASMLQGFLLGAYPSNRRGRAHGACTASARREEAAMSMYIVDDEQRRDRRATPMRPSGSGLAGTSAALALLDDVHRHRLRRTALHLPPPGQERGPFYYSDRLLGCTLCYSTRLFEGLSALVCCNHYAI